MSPQNRSYILYPEGLWEETPWSPKRYAHIIRYHKEEHILSIEHQEDITFREKDLYPVSGSQNDPMVIRMDVANYLVHKSSIDNGSLIYIIFSSMLKRMDLGNLQLKLVNTPLVGFGGSEVLSKGTIDLPISIGEEPTRRICMIQFLVVDSPFTYNVVLGQPGLNMFQVVVSTYYVKMKFPTKGGIGKLKCDQREARRCYNLSMKNPDAEKIIEKIKVGEQGGGNKELKKMKRERIEPIEGHKEIELLLGEQEKLLESDRR
ncbi:UNVERIFIED_CONTAM: hypothetical protein Sangu_2519200 [Sesamum angustifolium]|uniref:Uncharacterized protein n=1 Tax=Sesamum angustifolium TaxID=2727405 RepID=A0AAW2JIA0_9LAMI